MRIIIGTLARVRNADQLEHFDGVTIGLFFAVSEVQPGNLHQLFRDPHERIERGHGILKDHRDLAAANFAQLFARKRKNVFAVEEYLARNDLALRFRNQAND